MTATKPARVSFGTPVADIPESLTAREGKGAPHWVKVAEHVRANPGTWHPVRIDRLTIKGHSHAVGRINAATKGRDGKQSNKAFTEPGYQAASREGTLYVRYDSPANVTKIRGKQSA